MRRFLIAALMLFGPDLFAQKADPSAGITGPCQENLSPSSPSYAGFDSISGAWTWFNDPRAIFDNGKTYIAAIDTRGHIRVAEYDNRQDRTYVADLGFFESDDHDNAGIRMTRDRHIEIYYSRHVNGDYFSQRSVRPEDITAWDPPVNLDAQYGLSAYTYANLVQLGDTLFNFYRARPDGEDYTTMCFSISTDDGKTWSRGIRLLKGNRPYFRVAGNGRNRIDIICNDGHPNIEPANSTYHFYFRNGWFRSDGSALGSPPFTPLADLTRIYDGNSAEGKSWVWDIRIDNLGHPVCAFNTTGTETAHRYHYAYWDGKAWKVKPLVENAGTYLYKAEAQYSGGMSVDPDSTHIVYCSIETEGVHKLWRFQTTDEGNTWERTQLTPEKAIRPFVIKGAPPGRRILYLTGRYGTYTDFDTWIRFLEGY